MVRGTLDPSAGVKLQLSSPKFEKAMMSWPARSAGWAIGGRLSKYAGAATTTLRTVSPIRVAISEESGS
jgi:hypothetical protein